VVSGHPLLVQSALDAVKQWRYKPTQLTGDPVEVDTTITVTFTMGWFKVCAVRQHGGRPSQAGFEGRELRQPVWVSAGTGNAGSGQQYSNDIKRSESNAWSSSRIGNEPFRPAGQWDLRTMWGNMSIIAKVVVGILFFCLLGRSAS